MISLQGGGFIQGIRWAQSSRYRRAASSESAAYPSASTFEEAHLRSTSTFFAHPERRLDIDSIARDERAQSAPACRVLYR